MLNKELYKLQNVCCFYCEEKMDKNPYSIYNRFGWTKDHFFSKKSGRTLGKTNKVLAHQKCNARKGQRPPTGKEIFLKRCLFTFTVLFIIIKLSVHKLHDSHH